MTQPACVLASSGASRGLTRKLSSLEPGVFQRRQAGDQPVGVTVQLAAERLDDGRDAQAHDRYRVNAATAAGWARALTCLR